jgi:CHAT domain-containing protein
MSQGMQQYQTGQVKAALQSWQQARSRYQQTQNRVGEAQALASLGAGYLALEQSRNAIAVLEPLLPLAQSLGDRPTEARTWGNLGIAYKSLGKYAKAIQAHKQAGKLLYALGDRQALGQALLNLGNTFEVVGDYENATIALQQSLKIAEQMSDRVGASIAHSNLGGVLANQKKYEAAIAALETSLNLSQDSRDLATQASTLINLGSVRHAKGDRTQAVAAYSQSLQLAQQLNQRELQAKALGSLGLVLADQRDFQSAIAHQQQSLAIARELNHPDLQGTALNNLAHTLYRAGKLAEAERQLQTAVKLLDALRPDLSDTYQVNLFETQIHTYNLLQQVQVAANKPEAALVASEQGRARAFVELLSRRSRPAETTPPPPPSLDRIRQTAKDHNATLVEYAIVPDDDFKFRGKQRAEREERLLIWVVSPNGKVDFRQVDLKFLWAQQLSLDRLVSDLRCDTLAVACEEPTRGTPNEDTATQPVQVEADTSLQVLHRLLIQPIADLLPTDPNAQVILIPQDALFLVPFPALRSPEGKYLIEQHTILTAPAIQVLDFTAKRHASQRQPNQVEIASRLDAPVLIVGNPTMPELPDGVLPALPGSEMEANAIAQLLNTPALIGKQATETRVVQQLTEAKLVHLATHGLLEYGTEPLPSTEVPGAIALAPSTDNDGLLTASEIFNLKLKADLVVLSACNTGRGRITGDGVVGLSRSWISAGAASVIVSLWAVPDAPTATLMMQFYQVLERSNKATALRQAMLITMKDYPNPRNWAAFTLIGEAE